MSGNLLFKTFPTSFIYDLTEIFCFPHKEIQDLYKTYLIDRKGRNFTYTYRY